MPVASWTLEREGDDLVVHAGADLRYAIADIAPSAADEVLAAWRSGDFAGVSRSQASAEIVDQLATVGALRPATVPGGSAFSTVVHFAGRPVPALARAIAATDSGAGDATLAVLVRTDATLADLAALAATMETAYLVVDVAYHHTVALGPLVVRGETACAGCLAGRISARWGDSRPPPEPAATHVPVVAAVVAHEVAKVAAGTSLLVNRTVAVDLDRWHTVEETLLRLPWCPMCGDGGATGGARQGRMDLPWVDER